MRRASVLFLGLWLVAGAHASGETQNNDNTIANGVQVPPKSPEEALRAMHVRPGFKVELVAAEPLVRDPIALAWGPDGKLWVVEMGDYPLGLDGKYKPGGQVRLLEDTDGDGKYDKMTVFLEGLNFPTSVLPWRKGILVTAAPDIFYAEDTDGDGKADWREVLFTGFIEGNPQHRVNTLAWGLDNWIYGANGDSGGTVRSVKTGATVNLRGRDFRIRPDEGLIDLQSGQTQYGRNRDDWGNWFGNNNSNPMWHFVLADHYIRRNPHLPAPDPRKHVSEARGAYRVFPTSKTLARFNDFFAANHITSACSSMIYRDELFGPEFANNAFISEPVHNLVHREVLTPDGVSFTSRRAADEKESEFLSSSDNWFRPTSLQTGPDGALWIADMYRAVIEHPQWIPKAWQDRLNLRAGDDMGRIYRVYPTGAKLRPIPRLDRLDTAGLVAALDSPNGWQRDLAHMMLLWNKDAAAVPLLAKLVKESRRPLCRLHALCVLDGLGALKADLVEHTLHDAHPGIRRHAVRLCERRWGQIPELHKAVVKLVADADPQVRLQLACTVGEFRSVGEWNDPLPGQTLGRLAVQAAGERYLTAAVMSSVHVENLEDLLLTVLKSPPQPVLLENLLRLANALNDQQALGTLLKTVTVPERGRYAAWQFTAAAALLDALDQRNTPLAKLKSASDETLKQGLERLSLLFGAARGIVKDAAAPREMRLLAFRLLGRGLDQQAEDIALMAEFLSPQSADDFQSAAVAALSRLRSPQIAPVLVQGWKGYGPTLRGQVFDVLLSRSEWTRAALQALENKTISPTEIDAARRQRLLEYRDSELRRRAAQLLAGAVNADRQKVIDGYQSVLTMKGEPSRGAVIFGKHCAACHRLGEVGNAVGPDLASLGDKSPPALLVAVLDPNRAVEARYVNYSAVTQNGLTLTGVLTTETGNSITLTGQDGKQQVILRKDLAELVSTGRSPMPEGLEKELSPQDLADLIAHLRSQGPLPQRKTFAGNQPELVRPGADGTLLLTATKAEIYGKSLVLEQRYGNLGYWNSEDDQAIWTVDVARPGKYAVRLEWACDQGSAGKMFLLQAEVNQFSARVRSTGSWDKYLQEEFGHIVLTAGRQRLTFRSAGRLSASPLLDLRFVKLVPVEKE
jgi:putative membrane-bound dehydrogenase-like protein